MPVWVNSDASMDISGAVGITTHMGNTLHFSNLNFLYVSLLLFVLVATSEVMLLMSMESLAALSKSWDLKCRSSLALATANSALNFRYLRNIHAFLTADVTTELVLLSVLVRAWLRVI